MDLHFLQWQQLAPNATRKKICRQTTSFAWNCGKFSYAKVEQTATF